MSSRDRERGTQAWFYAGMEAAQAAIREDANLEESARAAHGVADALVARSPEQGARACAPSCAWCCHLPVGVTRAEAAAIVDALRGRDERGWTARLRRLREEAARRESSSWQELAAARPRCVLLGPDDRCEVYEQRPIACRGWHSQSRDACETGHVSGAVPPLDVPAWAMCLGVHEALATRVGGGTDELTAALVRAAGELVPPG